MSDFVPEGPVVAGVALVAADTGRVLMIQRAMIEGEVAGGKWEFPGGRMDAGEDAWRAATREFAEETGHTLPDPSIVTATWLSANGVYQGFVVLVPEETSFPLNQTDPENREVKDPDNAGGNFTEALAWFDPTVLSRGWNGLREECKLTPWKLIRDATPATPADINEQEAVVAAANEIVVKVRPEIDWAEFDAGLAERGLPPRVPAETVIKRDAAPTMDALTAALAAPAAALLPEEPLRGPTPYTLDADAGTADGHLALWASCHIGYPGCVKPPREDSFDFFNLGDSVTADGRHVPVGKVTIGTGHAGADLSWRTAAAHYDESGTGAAVAHAVADRWGIRLPSVLVADVTGAQVDELRRSPLSGDWRRVNGRLRLVAALGVNVPGYPVPRALVAGGDVQAMFVGFDPADAAALVVEADELASSLGLDPKSRAAAIRAGLFG